MQRRAAILALAALVLGLLLALPGSASAGLPSMLSARLSGANEVPPAAADGRGSATVRLRDGEVCFQVSWRGIGAPMAAHIHAGAKGVNGPIAVLLFAGEVPAPLSTVGGCLSADPDLVRQIRAHPGQYYVNVHNADFPGGAVRGQLGAGGEFDLGVADLSAELAGGNEVPPADADGSGLARIELREHRVCFRVGFRAIGPPIFTHIHQGEAGVNGPVVVVFFDAPDGLPPTISGFGGCQSASGALIRAIRDDPGGYYVNVHNADFPGGAIRGQLED